MSTNTILLKLNATADILGGEIFFSDENGCDPIYENNGLEPNSMYIRLVGSDESVAYISAFEIDNILSSIKSLNEKAVTLQTLLDDKASNTELKLLKSDLDTKADLTRVTAIENDFNNKADKTDVDLLIETINSKGDKSIVDKLVEDIKLKGNQSDISRLFQEINEKASIAEVNSIKKDITTLQSIVNSITDKGTIESLSKQIAALENKLAVKLSNDDLSGIHYSITNIKNDISSINKQIATNKEDISKKAAKTELETKFNVLKSILNNLHNNIESKANMSDVALKANLSDVTALTDKITSLNKVINDIKCSDETVYNELYNKLNSKADKKYTYDFIDTISESVKNKVDLDTYNSDTNNITKRLTNIETKWVEEYENIKKEIDEIECEVKNSLATLQAKDTDINKQLSNQNKIIDLLKTTTNQHTELLKYPCVRVLTTNEYKRLRDYDPDLTYYSSYYKYPNIIYFIVDYNKPKALYIGNIQIAKAEQRGSIGFDYTFPISF